MFNVKKESKHERSVAFHAEAPFAKHDYRYRSRSNIRMAGAVWAESPDERSRRLERTRKKEQMKNTPVGINFGEKDSFGPDNTYGTVEFIKQIPDQAHYRVNRNH
jgi:hypothetical protein